MMTLVGGEGNDKLTGSSDSDLILGNQGDDSVFGLADNDSLYGGMGADTVLGDQGNDLVLGNRGNDVLYGGKGNDSLYGGKGNDLLVGGLGDDFISGDQGDDTASFAGTRASYTITRNDAGNYIVVGPDGTDTVSTVEHFQFSDGTIDAAYLIQGTGGGGGGTVTPPPVNNAPVANNDQFTVQAENALTISPQSLLTNDTDADGNPLTVMDVTAPSHGTLTQDQNGSYVYTPDQAYFGTDAFTYKANDGTANSNSAIVSISVVDNFPQANPDMNTATIGSNAPVTGNVLDNDTDADVFSIGNSDVLTVNTTGSFRGNYGILDLNGDGSYSYAPNSSAPQPNGPISDVFDYSITDRGNAQSLSTLTISINVLPIALPDQS